jgi:hypothetical protein
VDKGHSVKKSRCLPALSSPIWEKKEHTIKLQNPPTINGNRTSIKASMPLVKRPTQMMNHITAVGSRSSPADSHRHRK